MGSPTTDTAVAPAAADEALVGSQMVARLRSGSAERWTEQAAACRYCARPIRLRVGRHCGSRHRGGPQHVRVEGRAGWRAVRPVRQPSSGGVPLLRS